MPRGRFPLLGPARSWSTVRRFDVASPTPPTRSRHIGETGTHIERALPHSDASSDDSTRSARAGVCCSRTIWAALHLRAARPLWSESGGRGGVSDLGGGGEQPAAEASAASTSGSPSAGTRNVVLCARRPAMPDGTKAIEGHPRASRSGVCLASLRAVWGCASLRLIARRWPVLRNRGGGAASRGSRPPRAMIARGRAGAPRRTRAIAQARRASRQAHP
jgi:hypothetical protein